MPVSGGRLCFSCTLAVANPSSRPSLRPWITRPLMLSVRVRREHLEFFAQRGQARGRRLRREELARMRLEAEYAAREAALARPGAEALQHRLVSAMDAVEIADGQRNRRQHRIGTAVGKQHEARGINAKV